MRHFHTHNTQQGAALIVALVFLIVLTLLGVSSMDDTVLEMQLAKHNREQNFALQVAEMGLMSSAPLLLQDSNATSDAQLNNLMQNRQLIIADPTNPYTEVDIQRDDISNDSYTVKAKSFGTEIHYKGKFLPKASSSPSSLNKTKDAYFETLTEGESAPGQRQIKLRVGIMRMVPSD